MPTMGHSEDVNRPRGEQQRQQYGDAAEQQALRGRLAEFVATAGAWRIQPLTLQTDNGHKTYRSSVSGRILLPVTGLAVGTDAELYRLTVKGGRFGSKAPVREQTIQTTYWHGCASRHIALEEMLVDALLRGIFESEQRPGP